MTGKSIHLFFIIALFYISPSHAMQQTSVGTVTLVIGQTQATNAQGEARLLKRQDAIFVGDIIETNQGSHLHIKFIDDGRISIRPESRLHIESYVYDQDTPKNSAIRFFLEKGVLRSISGKATEAAHDRYRMNTPVAALGVLGTDYVVRTSSQRTLAAVYSGSIALSPINYGCSNSGLGACASATILTADMRNRYLEVNLGEKKSQLKIQSQTGTLIDTGKANTDSANNIQKADNQVDATTDKNTQQVAVNPPADGLVTTSSNTAASTAVGQNTASDILLTDTTNSVTNNDLASKARLGTTPITREATTTPDAQLSSAPEQIAPIFTWARWTNAKQTDDTLSQTQSAVTKNQKITVGNQYAGLFRDTGSVADRRPQTGVFNFNMQKSQVVFIRPGQTWVNAETGTLSKSALQIDFGKRQVSTQLEMSTPSISATQLNVTGKINNNGIFVGSNGAGKIAGAVSSTGKQAGMMFEKPLANGRFNGISTWQQP